MDKSFRDISNFVETSDVVLIFSTTSEVFVVTKNGRRMGAGHKHTPRFLEKVE